MFKRFMNDKSGATAIEYGLVAALIGIAIIASLTAIGDALEGVFGEVTLALEGPEPVEEPTSE